nr:SIS domain-containing protein [Saprospiraceae bacterium]
MQPTIKFLLKDIHDTHKALMEDVELINQLQISVKKITACFQAGGKLLICGNGGSASQAEHLAAEFTGRFKLERPPLHAETLHNNISHLTAVANDYHFSQVFKRSLQAVGKTNDILLALSTSGQSENVIEVLKEAKKMGISSILWTGNKDGAAAKIADLALRYPGANTARIQEGHLVFSHILCELVETEMFG